MDVVCERLEKTPLWEDAHANYETENERIQLSNYLNRPVFARDSIT